jgi:hypothetical protein
MGQARPRFGALQIGIIVLTVATAVIHFALAFDWLFWANGIGYLALLAGLYLPLPWLAPWRRAFRWLLIAYAAVTVMLWLLLAPDKSLSTNMGRIGYVDKAIEIALIVLLWIEDQRAASTQAP